MARMVARVTGNRVDCCLGARTEARGPPMEVDPMTDVAVWATESLPRRDAFDAWREKMCELHLAWTLSRPASEEFSAAVRYRRLDDLTIADFRGGRFAGSRLERGLHAPGQQ